MKIVKKVTKILFIIVFVLLVTGCGTNKDKTSFDGKYDISGLKHSTCTRDAYTDDSDTTVKINYNLYSDNDGYLQILNSKEEITSTNSNVLDQYEEAYKSIYKIYDGIEYYDNEVVRTNNKVTSTTYIHYGKVDMDKIMSIEGEEDNVKVVDGKIKLSDWKSFAKKYGTTCN